MAPQYWFFRNIFKWLHHFRDLVAIQNSEPNLVPQSSLTILLKMGMNWSFSGTVWGLQKWKEIEDLKWFFEEYLSMMYKCNCSVLENSLRSHERKYPQMMFVLASIFRNWVSVTETVYLSLWLCLWVCVFVCVCVTWLTLSGLSVWLSVSYYHYVCVCVWVCEHQKPENKCLIDGKIPSFGILLAHDMILCAKIINCDLKLW